MYENYDKKSPSPCMSKGNQKKKTFLDTPTRNTQRTYPCGKLTSGATMANEQHKTLKEGSGLMGSVPCGGGKFGTEKPKNW